MDLLPIPEATAKPPSEKNHPYGWVTLGCVPKSPTALELVRELVVAIEAGEDRRRRRSAQAQEAFTEAVGRFVADLILAAEGNGLGELACQKNSNAFADLPVGYRDFMAAYGGLGALGLFERIKRGSFRRPFDGALGESANDEGFVSSGGPHGRMGGSGQCERICPTEKLRQLARGHGIARGKFRQHFEGRMAPLELREPSARNGWEKISGLRLRIAPGDREAARLREDVEALNDFIAGVRVEWEEDGPPLLGWTRMFHEGTSEGYQWNKGGRLYAAPRGDASYQGKPASIRGSILLNGEAVVELDIRASHLAIAYGICGQSLEYRMRELQPEVRDPNHLDPYAVGGLPRAVVKAWVTVAFGKGRHPSRWSPTIKKALLKGDGKIDLKEYPVSRVEAAVLRAHPVLRDLAGITWGKLQFIESQAIIATMQRLNREHTIPVLPVHDSIIVPRSAWRVARLVLEEELEKATGFRPLPPKLAPQDARPGWEPLSA